MKLIAFWNKDRDIYEISPEGDNIIAEVQDTKKCLNLMNAASELENAKAVARVASGRLWGLINVYQPAQQPTKGVRNDNS